MMLTSIESVIDAIGQETAKELAGVGDSAVSNWRARGKFPADLLVPFSLELEKNNNFADPALFGPRTREGRAK
jgi:hypothetical protein